MLVTVSLQIYSYSICMHHQKITPTKLHMIHTFSALVDCAGNSDLVNNARGFAQLTKDDYDVQFIHENGKHFVKIKWKAPIGT